MDALQDRVGGLISCSQKRKIDTNPTPTVQSNTTATSQSPLSLPNPCHVIISPATPASRPQISQTPPISNLDANLSILPSFGNLLVIKKR
uniref:Uncharacterized protein n=1 Tax=Kalanchoe fedtschenkoi TaxID=63787 RepID=A0A7N0V821_KALFE